MGQRLTEYLLKTNKGVNAQIIDFAKVNWKLSGWFEKLKFHFVGIVISAGPHLISISVPDFLS